MSRPLAESLTGCVLGTAAGDSIGLPFEKLSRRAVERVMTLPLEQSLVAGRGLVSDDTEHTLLVRLSLIDARGDVRHGDDFRTAVTEVVRCGGDTDSTAAVVGAIVGAGLGAQAIPASWLDRLAAWPRGPRWIREHCAVLAQGRGASPGSPWRELLMWPWTLARNLAVFVLLVGVLVRRTVQVAWRSRCRPASERADHGARSKSS